MHHDIKVIVAHPEKQHSFHTAKALYDNGLLYKYMTTLYLTKGTFSKLAFNFLTDNKKKKFMSRKCKFLPDDHVVVRCELQNILCRLLSGFITSKQIKKRLYLWVVNSFGRKVARYAIRNNVDAVIMYDETASECFRILKDKAPHIKRIQDVSTVNRIYIKTIYEQDMKQYGHKGFYIENPYLWDEWYIKYCQREIDFTDYFLFPSKFVRDSYVSLNSAIRDRYSIIPYGVDSNLFSGINANYNSKNCRELNLLFVGQIHIYKGLHHLLKVVSELRDSGVKLTLIGKYSPESTLYNEYKEADNINFCGFVNFNELPQYYQASDLFVFPTMGEGFGLVVLEAMSAGIGVICSENAGGNDVVYEGRNGFTYAPLDESELKRIIMWFVEHRDSVVEFGKESRKIAREYTWDKYYSSVFKAVSGLNQ